MKYLIISILSFFVSINLYSQNIYSNYSVNDTIQGERLQVSTGSLNYFKQANYGSQFQISLSANYSKWKFTPKSLYYLQARVYDSYSKFTPSSSNDDVYKRNFLETSLYGGTSYYLQPGKFYVSGAAALSSYMAEESQQQISYSSNFLQGLLLGGIGFGRIYNAQGLQSADYFSQALIKRRIIKNKLSSKTLLEIDKLIYAYRNGNYYNKYKDDKESILFKDIEAVLLRNNEIENNLDIETAISLYTIFSNTSGKFFYYPRYTGYQIQSELQYQAFGHDAARDNYLKISGVYGIPVSVQTNILLSGFYARAIGDKTTGFLNSSPQYYNFYQGPFDINSLSLNNLGGPSEFFNPGIANFLSSKSVIGTKVNLTHTLNSTAGISLSAYYNFYPENPDLGILNNEFCGLDANFSYNVYSKLFANLNLGYRYQKVVYNESFGVSFGLDYVIF